MISGDVGEKRCSTPRTGSSAIEPAYTYGLSQVILLFRVPQFVLRRTIQNSDGLERDNKKVGRSRRDGARTMLNTV